MDELKETLNKIEELTTKNAELLELKQKANGEAKRYRETIEAFKKHVGIDVPKLAETLGKLKTGELTPEELPETIREQLEKLRPAMSDDTLIGKAEVVSRIEKTAVSNQESTQLKDLLQKLEAENSKLRLSHTLLSSGAKSSEVESLMKLWEDPKIEDGQDAQAVISEKIKAFSERYPWGFGSVQPEAPQAPQAKTIAPPVNGSINSAVMNKDAVLEDRLNNAVKSGDFEAVTRTLRQMGEKI